MLRVTSGGLGRIVRMRVGVVDVGSNTVRLLVAGRGDSAPVRVCTEKAYVGLAAELMRRGEIGAEKLAETARVVGEYAALARRLGAQHIEIVLTAPGRQAPNGDELLHAVARAARAPARILTGREEGLLAYEGAVACAGALPETVAVCDVGGGSTELVVGRPPAPPAWSASVDVGALGLTVASLPSDPPTSDELAAAAEEVDRRFAALEPPRPLGALAVGGSARALSRLVGPTLGVEELDEALARSAERPAAKLARRYGLERERARVLPAGALILRAIAERLGVPLELARGGLREGIAAGLLAEAEAA
jgi:exopolyphosphatase/guanosine-5'-triphosphate,3'-diphosphate pyrophosphatase